MYADIALGIFQPVVQLANGQYAAEIFPLLSKDASTVIDLLYKMCWLTHYLNFILKTATV